MATNFTIAPSIYSQQPVDVKGMMSPEALVGAGLGANMLFGSDRDAYVKVYDSRVRHIDLDSVIGNSDAVLLYGEDAFEFDTPQGIMNGLIQMGILPTKRYLAVLQGPKEFYVVQADTMDLFQGLVCILLWVNETPADYIKELADQSDRIDYGVYQCNL